MTLTSDHALADDTRREGDHAAEDLTRGVQVRPRRLAWRRHRYWILSILGLFLGAHLISGFYVVGADERAVVRRFGAVAAEVGPGMHYRFPWPVDRLDVVKTTSVKKVGVGFAIPAGESAAPSGMELVTGDTNIVNAALVLQYVVRDPAEFLFQIEEAPAYVEAVAEGVLTETVIGMPIDEVLTRGRVAAQERVKAATQEERGGGLQATARRRCRRRDKPFLALQKEYEKAPDVTRTRLYLEAMAIGIKPEQECVSPNALAEPVL
jgi:membrane protease subunit HflK